MRTFVLVLLVGILIPSTSHAQTSHAASPAAIERALQDRVAETQGERDRVRRLLQRPEVRSLAGDLGVDLRGAESAVAHLEGRALTDLAAQAQRVEDALAGGQSKVTVSTTYLIIALLLLIVLILALK